MLVLALLVASAAASSLGASSAATAWLESHKSPTDDQLKQLQGVNPEAAAIVNALLSKHMKHLRKAGEPSGADIFRSMMTPRHLSLATHGGSSYASAVTPTVAQAQFNPNAQANRDQSAVSRLLSAVASMGGSKGKKISALLKKREHKEVTNALTEDASLFEDAPKAVPVQAIEVPDVAAELAAPVPAPEKHVNSYLAGMDLSGDMPESTAAKHAHHKQENTYLKGMDLSSGSNSLSSFSFGDDAPAAPKPVPKKVVPAKPKVNNAFMDWLGGGVKKVPAPEEKPVEAPQPTKKTNSYLDQVKFFG